MTRPTFNYRNISDKSMRWKVENTYLYKRIEKKNKYDEYYGDKYY